MRIAPHYFTDVRKTIIRIAWILLLSSCLSPIEFPTDNIGNRLVVSGQVSPIVDQNYVQLGRTAETDRLPFPLSGALVQLFDDVGNEFAYKEDEFNPGMYLLDGFTGVPSTQYFIRISTPEGETYESTPEIMPEEAGTITTYFDFQREETTDNEGIITEKPFIKIYANALLPSSTGNVYMKWNVDEAFLLSPTDFPDPFGSVPPPCYIVQNADPQRISLFNGEEVNAAAVEGFLMASRIIDWSFHERHYFTIYQSSLTTEAYEYWRKVNVVANQVGSIFDMPPAEISGNIRNINNSAEKVLGYFQATNQTFDRFDVLKTDLPFPVPATPCTFDNRNYQDYQMRCLDCLSIRNSSYRRPEWF